MLKDLEKRSLNCINHKVHGMSNREVKGQGMRSTRVRQVENPVKGKNWMMGVRQWIRRDGSILEVDCWRAEKESAWDGSRRRWLPFKKTVGRYSKSRREDPPLRTGSRGWQPRRNPQQREQGLVFDDRCAVYFQTVTAPPLEIEIVAACAAGAVAP